MSTAQCTFGQHPGTGWETVTLSCRGSSATFTPQIGCNLLSFVVDGQDYIVALDESSGNGILGTPILYPMPNRVRDGVFTFAGRSFRFEPNNGPNYIHGLVRDQAWTVGEPILGENEASISAHIYMVPGGPLYALFPIANTLQVTYTLRPGQLTLAFAVHNDDETQELPFGLAIHPYFPIIGRRDEITLQVPATAWMEAKNLLPTGQLLPLAQGPADLTQPQSLDPLDLDDVFWGMAPERPAQVEYQAIGKRLTLTADALFTHAVVYTPQGKPFFCIENQSCSTDAHNLYARDMQQAAHLTILPPGDSLEASIRVQIGEL